eukprot:1297250-Rhodomonas_salina.2
MHAKAKGTIRCCGFQRKQVRWYAFRVCQYRRKLVDKFIFLRMSVPELAYGAGRRVYVFLPLFVTPQTLLSPVDLPPSTSERGSSG